MTAALDDAGLSNTVVDRRTRDGVAVAGEATDTEVLRAAEGQNAPSVGLALLDDTTTEFAKLVVRGLAPHVELIARIEEMETLKKMYRAGADYVLSLGFITGRMVASAVLDGEDVLSLDQQVAVVRTKTPGPAGTTLCEADVRAQTGWTAVAVERDDAVITDVGPGFRIRRDDGVILAGTDDSVNQFTELLG